MIDPVALSVKIKESDRINCCCLPEEVPCCVTNMLSGTLCTENRDRGVYVTLGYFSVVRLERPSQFIVSALDYSVPDKVCRAVQEEDPCALFSKMSFPSGEFAAPYCQE